MLILYDPQDGEIFYAIKTADIPTFIHSTTIPLSSAEISDEDDNLQAIRAEIIRHQGRKDENGQGRFFVDTSSNPPSLSEKLGWVEVQEGGIG